MHSDRARRDWVEAPSYLPRAPPARMPQRALNDEKIAPAATLKSRIGPIRARDSSFQDGEIKSPSKPSKA